MWEDSSIPKFGTNGDGIRDPKRSLRVVYDYSCKKDFQKPSGPFWGSLRKHSIVFLFSFLRDSVIEKCKYPLYNKIKGKLPSAIFAPATFTELNRLAGWLSSCQFCFSACYICWVGRVFTALCRHFFDVRNVCT